MRDKSQKDDMRAALQGDLERARERRGSTLLDREPEPEPVLEEPEPVAEEVSDTPADAQEPVPHVAETLEPEPEPELAAEPEAVSDTPSEGPEPTPPVSDMEEPEPRRRFLWFLRR